MAPQPQSAKWLEVFLIQHAIPTSPSPGCASATRHYDYRLNASTQQTRMPSYGQFVRQHTIFVISAPKGLSWCLWCPNHSFQASWKKSMACQLAATMVHYACMTGHATVYLSPVCATLCKCCGASCDLCEHRKRSSTSSVGGLQPIDSSPKPVLVPTCWHVSQRIDQVISGLSLSLIVWLGTL